MSNRLSGEMSPYLLQHKDNPVDWRPWGEEAFQSARAEDKPVFLSIGYSSCHWCHVMAHESFEDKEVAAVLNDSFVCVKVDREERPDVDAAYMAAVQLSSGRGGWPMSLFLTPDKKPFFAGTYFPREDRAGHPGFLSVCRQVATLWRTKRASIEDNADQFAVGLNEVLGQRPPGTFARLDEEFVGNAVKALAADFDNEHGGFGTAPKFPPHTSIDFLLRYALRETAPEDLRQVAAEMALATLEQMALGGIHDHVGGGFHRYSTDAEWHLPHFEKMLYDNALMLGNYSLAAALCEAMNDPGEALFGHVVDGINAWMLGEMSQPRGYASAIDADSEGEEGKYYTWTAAEIDEVLGKRAAAFRRGYGILDEGNFRDEATGKSTGANVLHRSPDIEGDFAADLDKLLELRNHREAPGLDHKALLGWTGLAIAGQAMAGEVEPALRVALSVLEAIGSGPLPHQIVDGIPSGAGYLDDYAGFALGLFALSGVFDMVGAPDERDLRGRAERITREMIELFWDETDGGFFGTSHQHEVLFGRTKPVFDSPTPSGNALALRCLISAGDLERAEKLIAALLGWMERAPQATEALYSGAMAFLDNRSDREVAHGEPVPAVVQQPPAKEVTVVLSSKEIAADGNGLGRGEVLIEIPGGYHINGNEPPARWLVPTNLSFQPLQARVDYPPTRQDVYTGTVRIPFALTLPKGSSGEEFEVRVSYQACTESECLPPDEKLLSGVLYR